jgi:hypothetical protein
MIGLINPRGNTVRLHHDATIRMTLTDEFRLAGIAGDDRIRVI